MMRFRPFEAQDIDALYAISLATGHIGKDAAHLYDDSRMMGHIYAAPYALLEPALALVVEENDEVAGFAVGTLDTSEWELRLEREWWPPLRRLYPDPVDTAPTLRSADQKRAFMIHHPTPTPVPVTEKYPAHLHLNLLPRLQHRGAGSKLFNAWVELADKYGAKAMHVAANRANIQAIGFWQKHAFKPMTLDGASEESRLWMVRS